MARYTTAGHRGSPHRALSAARRTQESGAHHGLRTERTGGARARDRPPRRAGRHRGTVAVPAGRDVERRSVGSALGAVGFSGRRRSRTRPRGSATTAPHARETLDALLAPL